MNKTKKSCIFALLGLFVLMMTAVSVNADEEPNLIATSPNADQEPNLIAPNTNNTDEETNLITPSPNIDEEPLVIAPRDIKQSEDTLSGDNAFTTGLILVIGISGVVGLAAALIIFKK